MKAGTEIAGTVGLVCAAALSVRVGGALWPLGVAATLTFVVHLWRRESGLAWGPSGIAMAAMGVVTGFGLGGLSTSAVASVAIPLGIVFVVFGRVDLSVARVQPALLLIGVSFICLGAAIGAADSDVVAAHDAAGAAVLSGESPYRDLGVVESNPHAPGKPIDGYSYPPVVVTVAAVGGRLLGDPRVVTALVWIALVSSAIRRYGIESPVPAMLALIPGLAPSVTYAWTEPLTGLLVAGALSLRGKQRAAVLGVALASKQYLVVGVPSVVVSWWSRRRWLLVASGVGLVVTLPVLVDPAGALDSLVLFHLERDVRPDSSNLAGFWVGRTGLRQWLVPSLLVAVAAGGLGAAVARRQGEDGWLGGLVVTIAITLAIGPVSLPNYWILVTILVLLNEGERGRGQSAAGGWRDAS